MSVNVSMTLWLLLFIADNDLVRFSRHKRNNVDIWVLGSDAGRRFSLLTAHIKFGSVVHLACYMYEDALVKVKIE
jgi:hypothetical protein